MSTATPPTEPDQPVSEEQLKFARGAVANELQYRRDKRWQVFSWTNTLLIAVAGGVPTLAQPQSLNLGIRITLTIAVAILTTHSLLWCAEQLSAEDKLKDIRQTIDRELHIPDMRTPTRIRGVGHHTILVMLALAAILAIWLSMPSNYHR